MMKKRSDLEQYRDVLVQDLITVNTSDGEGFRVDDIKNFTKFLQNKTALTHELMHEEGFKEQFDQLRYAFPRSHNPMTDFTLNPVLSKLPKGTSATFGNLVGLMQEKVNEIGKLPLQPFNIYFITDSQPDSSFSSLTVTLDDIIIEVKRIEDFKDTLTDESFVIKQKELEEFIGIAYPANSVHCIHMEILARNHHYAIQKGIQYVRFILGLIGLVNNFQNMFMTFSSFSMCYNKSPSPVLLFVGNKDKNCIDILGWKYDKVQLNCPVNLVALDQICSVYVKGTLDSRDILFSAINSFYTGLHEDNENYAFLAFWASLERICLYDLSLSHDKVLNRVFSIFRHPRKINEFELTRLLRLRNEAIHSWKYDAIGEYERDLIKNYTELMIDFFMWNLMQLNKSEIELFFTKFHCTQKELDHHQQSDIKVFNLIKKLRNFTRFSPNGGKK